MIEDIDGRLTSIRTKEEEIELLRREFAQLSPDERDALRHLMGELGDPAFMDVEDANDVGGPVRILDAIKDAEFLREPVSVKQFIMDPYYLGETCGEFYPELIPDMEELFAGGYSEVILTGCVSHDTLIQGSDGSLATLGERMGSAPDVLTIADGNGLEASASKGVKDSGFRKVVRLMLANGMTVDLTPDHKVRVWSEDNYGWMPAGELSENDLVVCARNIRTEPSSELSASHAKILAYWSGYGSSDYYRARFADGNPETSIDVMRLLKENGWGGYRNPKGEACWDVAVKNAKTSGFLEWLKSHGADRKTHYVRVPDSVCRASNEVVAAFIGSLWACEGCVYAPPNNKSPPRYSIGMVSERFIREVQLLLLRFSVRARTGPVVWKDKRTGKESRGWQLQVSGCDNLKAFSEAIGPILGKESACKRIVSYYVSTEGNTDVDTLPFTWGWLNDQMVSAGINRPIGNHWWKFGAQRTRRLSRKMLSRWLGDYGHTVLAKSIRSNFSEDIAYERVKSIESIVVEIPTGDVCDVLTGNRFLGNGISLANSIGWGKSVTKSTTCVDGLTGRRMQIDEMVDRDVILPSLDGNQIVHRKPSKIWKCGHKQCFRMTLASGQYLEASKDHPVLTPVGYVPLLDLKPGSLVAAARSVPEPVTTLRISNERVKAAAYLIADGSLTTSSCVYIKGDRRVVDDFKICAKHIPGFNGFGCEKHKRGAWYITVCGAMDWVRSLFIDTLPKKKRVPSEFFGLNNSQLALFLNRLFTDGNIYTGSPRKIELTLASEGLIDDVQYLLRRFGIIARKSYKQKSIKQDDGTKNKYDAWRLQIADASMQIVFIEFIGPIFGKEKECEKLLAQALETKDNPNWDLVPITVEELKEIRKETSPHTNKEWNDAGGALVKGSFMGRSNYQKLCENTGYRGRYRKFADMDVVWERIKSIDDIGWHDVYDLTVPGTKNAIANGIVIHNTFFGSIALCRMLYNISCLRNPHRSFGIAAKSNLAIVALSVSEGLAIKVIFENVATKIAASPYFQEHYPYEETKKEMRFPNNVWVAARASTDSSALGLNVFGAIIDEGNFMAPAKKGTEGTRFGKKDQAEMLYDKLKRRMKSRFQRNGRMPGMMIVVSSKNTKDDFTRKVVEDQKDSPEVFVRDYALWDVKSDRYSKEKFKVLVGNENVPSKVLTPKEVEELKGNMQEGMHIIDVPVDFRDDFENDVDGCFTGDTNIQLLDGTSVSIRDLVGVEEFWVYSFGADGRFYPGRGHSARLVRVNTEIVEVEIDGGEKIRCTPDHMFMLRNGDYCEASDLKCGDRLMPLYRRFDRYGYELLKSNMGGKGVHVHKLVARETYNGGHKIDKGLVIHHRNFNKLDNSPSNLQIMRVEDHNELHSKNLHKSIHTDESKRKASQSKLRLFESDPEYRAKVFIALEKAQKIYFGSKKHRETASRIGKEFGFGTENPSDRMTRARSENGTKNILKLNLSDSNPSKKPENRKRSSERLKNIPKEERERINRIARHTRWHEGPLEKCGIYDGTITPKYKIKKPDHPSSKGGRVGCHVRWHGGDFDTCENCNPIEDLVFSDNHKVVAVRSAEKADVYDISVDIHHNFSLSAGVVVHNSIRDIAGVETVARSPYIQQRDRIALCTNNEAFPQRKHPFDVIEWDQSKPGDFKWSRIAHKVDIHDGGEVFKAWQPKYYPGHSRHIHIDPSLNSDATGFAVGCVIGYTEVRRRDKNNFSEVYTESAPVIWIDFMLRIIPPVGGEIDYGKIRSLVYKLQAHGFPIGLATMDQYNSADTMQKFTVKGIETERVSLDRTMDPYDTLKAGIYEGRVHMYKYRPAREELQSLQRDNVKNKIDHPPKGCFTGDTRVALLDGTLPTFEELAERFPNSERFPVYSIGPDGICCGWGENPRVTRKEAELIEVTLDNYQVIQCTPDHLFMTIDREWVQAHDLTPDVSIMPLYRSMTNNGEWAGYERLYCPISRQMVMTHQLMAVQAQEDLTGCHVHHEDILLQRISTQRNHRVSSVRKISKTADVWDITVPDLENFALASGVFVHNSKDVADALAGVVFTLTTNYRGGPLGIVKGISSYGNMSTEEQRVMVERDDDDDDDGALLPFITG